MSDISIPRPIVMQEEESKGFEMSSLGKYADYSITFLWYTQLSSVGQVSGNLSLCTGNGTVIYNKTLGVVDEYKNQEYGLAGNSTYNILKSVDPLIFSCYYSAFEYAIALELYT